MISDKEKELKANKDFMGLLDNCLAQSGSIGGLNNKLCKVSYYSGRAKSQQIVSNFVEKNKSLLSAFVNEDYFILAQFLFRVGFVFPNINEAEISMLEKYYSDPKYVDLLDDILFDKELLSKELKRFDTSARNKKHSQFSDDLLIQTFNSDIYNQEPEDDKIYFYDKSNNSILKASFEDRSLIRGVHYQIQLFRDFRHFVKIVDEVLGEEIRIAYFRDNTDNIMSGASYENILFLGFSSYSFDEFKSYVENNIQYFDLPGEPIQLLKKTISRKWLEMVNGKE
jgi:hypothetical protein